MEINQISKMHGNNQMHSGSNSKIIILIKCSVLIKNSYHYQKPVQM